MAEDILLNFGKTTGVDVSGDLEQLRKLGGNPDAIKKWAAGHAMEADKLLPKFETMILGGSIQRQGFDPLTGQPVAPGQTFKTTMTPGQAAQLQQSERHFQANQNKPIFSAEMGGFVVPPSAGKEASLIPVAGGKGKPLTEAQGNATGFGMRMAEANKIITDLEEKGKKDTGLLRTGVTGAVSSVPLIGEALGKGSDNVFNVLPSILGGLSEDQQKVLQARVNFITAIMRKESGAVISPTDFATAEKTYFPAAGDSAAVVKQKQQARQTAIKAMETAAGPGAAEIKSIGSAQQGKTGATVSNW
jgi:hypothetical protein